MATKSIKVKVIQVGKAYRVRFTFGVQTFQIVSGESKKEALWFAKMLRACFARYANSLKK